jgi:hypothetical protein
VIGSYRKIFIPSHLCHSSAAVPERRDRKICTLRALYKVQTLGGIRRAL